MTKLVACSVHSALTNFSTQLEAQAQHATREAQIAALPAVLDPNSPDLAHAAIAWNAKAEAYAHAASQLNAVRQAITSELFILADSEPAPSPRFPVPDPGPRSPARD